jgi:hypothetical protein
MEAPDDHGAEHSHAHTHPELQASEPAPAAEPADEPGQADLLSLALLVFFVALIGVVGALLLLPALS